MWFSSSIARTLALYLLALSTVVLASHAARVRRELVPIALVLAYGFVTDLTRRAIRILVLDPATAGAEAGAPLVGLTRVAGHTSQALLVGWSAALVALAVQLFAGWRPWGVLAGWAVLVAALIFGYPALRGDALAEVYFWITVSVLVLSALAIVRFAVKRRRPGQEHAAALWMLAIEGSLLLGPYLAGDPFRKWWPAQIAYGVMYVGLCLIFLGGLAWNQPPTSSTK